MKLKSIHSYLFLFITSLFIVGCLDLNPSKFPLVDETHSITVSPSTTPTRYIFTIGVSTETPEVQSTQVPTDYKNQILQNRIDFETIPPGVYLLYSDWKSTDYIYGFNIETNEEVFFSEYMFQHSNNKEYTSYRTDDGNLMILNLITEDEVKIELNSQCYKRSWSPDDRYLAINCEDQIYAINIEDSWVQQLTSSIHPSVDSYQNPIWSPNGRWIAITYHDLMSLNSTKNNGLYLIDSNCISKSTQCDQAKVGPFFPYSIHSEYSWSPDSKSIVTYYNNALQVVNIETSETNILVDKIFDVGGLYWAQTDWIYYSQFSRSEVENTVNIYKISSQEGEPILIAEDKGFISGLIEVTN
jgi:hypothetical protein